MIRVIAHRGDSETARENTLPAVAAALDAGADAIEIDIRTTADGRSIVLHDPTTLRLWGRARSAIEQTLSRIGELGVADCRIPSLVDVLDLLADAAGAPTLLIDTVDLRDVLVALGDVARHAGVGEGLVKVAWCGDLAAMEAVRRSDPRATVSYNHLGGELDESTILRLGASTVNLERTLLNLDLIEQIHRLGVDVATWTVDDAETMSWAIDAGVDAVITNRPRLLRRLLAGPSPLALAWTGGVDLAVRTGMDAEHARWIAVARELGEWAIGFTRTASLGEVTTKAGPADLVTEVDRAVERHVREVIAAEFPDHLVVGEEMGGTAEPGRPTWYLDPVDGTTNLANGLPWTAMSLALAIDHDPIVAVVSQPWLGHVFLAAAGFGATLDGEPLEVGDVSELSGRLVMTEWDAHRPWPGMSSILGGLAALACTPRVMGSSTLTTTGVAAGWGVAGLVHRFSPIDDLAGVLISHEAGARVVDQQGRDTLWPDVGGVLVSLPGVADDLLKLWQTSFSRVL